MILPSPASSSLSEGEDQMISFVPSSLGAEGVAGPLQRERARDEAYLDDENLLGSTGRPRMRPRLEKRNSTPSTERPGAPPADHPRPFTTATGPGVTQENSTGDVTSSSGTSNAPTASMTPWMSPPDPSLPPVQGQQSSARPSESITTVLRGTKPRAGLLIPIVDSNVYETLAPGFPTLDVDVRTPRYDGGAFLYRDRVIARLSLTGTVFLQFNQALLGPATPNESQLVLHCYAECQSCISSKSPRCSPIGWYLDPVHDPKDNLAFMRHPLSGTFTGNVTFTIPRRPRRPKPQDQTRRCASESLM
jgi:hypothetical protein